MSGRTPLILAGNAGSNETISLLLTLGASPDRMDYRGTTALLYAIMSKCVHTINLLAPVTNVKLEEALGLLAKFKVEPITGELKQLVEKASQDKEVAMIGLKAAATFGSSTIIDLIAQYTKDHVMFERMRPEIWMEAVKSDSEAAVSALLSLLPEPPSEAISLARE